ncbi:MAG: DUF3025 domain-containing protein [Polyangiaceae bacterium]
MKSIPRFLRTDAPALAPFAAILSAMPSDRLPTVEEIDGACGARASMRFERAAPRPRRAARRAQDDTRPSYDERIAEGVVPTRAENLHDLMNAVVWAAFPRAKRAIHAIQLAHLRASIDRSARSPAHDTIAMLDEGGVLFAGSPDEPRGMIVVGHAILEHTLTRSRPVFGLGVEVERIDRPLDELDRELAGMLDSPGRFVSHRSFPRVRVGG